MSPFFLVLIAILALQAIAFAIAAIARFWVLRSEEFTMRGIDVERASELVAAYVAGVHDHRFGFPTGVFAIDEQRSSSGRIVAREINFQGSAGLAPIKFGLTLPLIGAAAGGAIGAVDEDAGGCLAGFVGAAVGFSLGLAAAAILVIPFAFLAIVEVILRALMRGEIAASIEKVGGPEDAVQVRFELRGLSAFGVEPQLRRGMASPRPDGAKAPAEPAASGHFDRLNTIYAAAASVGIVVSIGAFAALDSVQTSGVDAATGSSEFGYYDEGAGDTTRAAGPTGGSGATGEYEYEQQPTEFEKARGAFLRYWTSVAYGDYGGAYDLYHPSFTAQAGLSRSDFISAENSYYPRISTSRIIARRSSRARDSDREMWLYAEVPIVDRRGEYANECRIFYGQVRMLRDGGRWYYRPGEFAGRSPSFGRSELGGGIKYRPVSDSRCP